MIMDKKFARNKYVILYYGYSKDQLGIGLGTVAQCAPANTAWARKQSITFSTTFITERYNIASL